MAKVDRVEGTGKWLRGSQCKKKKKNNNKDFSDYYCESQCKEVKLKH